MIRSLSFLLALCLSVVTLGPAHAEPAAAPGAPALAARREAAVARLFDRLRSAPPQLRMFLEEMPKGADLHVHASGSVYAEDYLQWAAADGDCIATDGTITAPPCAAPNRPATDMLTDMPARNREINVLSMRGFVPGPETGHDHFFATFDKFELVARDHPVEKLAETVRSAGLNHVEYIEVMTTMGGQPLADAVRGVPMTTDFAALRAALFAHGFAKVVSSARQTLDDLERARRKLMGCDGPSPERACAVHVRYLQQVIRVLPPVSVFAQALLAYELAHVDPRVVGLNFVAPEDDVVSLRDYDLHMHMLQALSRLEPPTHITLHAGELTLGLVPPHDLTFHIREAVEVAGAQRIGHGVDISYETNAPQLLEELRRRHVMVEINLTSNDQILGVRGAQSPFMTYLRAGVPVALSTDDEGVSRIDLTHEYERAVLTYGLSYPTVKELSRTSLDYGFIPGASLWADLAAERPAAACAGDALGAPRPSPRCASFLAGSEKARLEWELEHSSATFETAVVRGAMPSIAR